MGINRVINCLVSSSPKVKSVANDVKIREIKYTSEKINFKKDLYFCNIKPKSNILFTEIIDNKR